MRAYWKELWEFARAYPVVAALLFLAGYFIGLMLI